MTKRTVSAAWVKGMVEFFCGVGLDPQSLFDEAGLLFEELSNSEARFESEKISMLWEIAAQRSGNPHLGLALDRVAKPGGFDVVLHVTMSCPDLLTGLQRMVYYIHIISSAADMQISEDAQGCYLTVNIDGGGAHVPKERFDFLMLMIVNLCRWLTGRDLALLSVDLKHSRPANLLPYLSAFKCPCYFNAPQYRLYFAHADLKLPLITSNPLLVELHERFATERLYRLENSRTSYQARELILTCLPEGEPSRGEVAKALCMSERTLHRRLQDEGTSFVQLVDDIRREQASRYLGQPDMPLIRISDLLGFANQSTFFRACRRWFDSSPAKYRDRLRNGSVSETEDEESVRRLG